MKIRTSILLSPRISRRAFLAASVAAPLKEDVAATPAAPTWRPKPTLRQIMSERMKLGREVRAEEEFHTEVAQLRARELELATLLVETLAANFRPRMVKKLMRAAGDNT